MNVKPPTKDQLLDLAAINHFSVTNEELDDFHDVIVNLFESYKALENMPSFVPTVRYPDRDSGMRPSRNEDPYNAIVRRCKIVGSGVGKLSGKRIGLKDNICMAGIPITCGSRVLGDYIPDMDATVVTRLLDAGAEIVAVLNMDNFAYSGAGNTSAHGPTLNPHNTDYLAGGSSGGSAASLFYDDIDMTLGGDQGGSIRVPASWSGVVGLKPTYGLVPYTGIVGIGHTFDHAGPLTLTVADNALMLEVIAGKDPMDPRQNGVYVDTYTKDLDQGVKGLRIGVVVEGFEQQNAEENVNESVRLALDQFVSMGAQLSDVSIPEHKNNIPVFFGISFPETAAVFQANSLGYGWKGLYNESLGITLGKQRRLNGDLLPDTLKVALMVGTYVNQMGRGGLYFKAQNLRFRWKEVYDKALRQFDILAMPTTPMKAYKHVPNIDRKQLVSEGWNMLSNTLPFDVTGHPALSIPCGMADKMPVGLMLVGKEFEEALLYRVANAFERSVDWRNLSI